LLARWKTELQIRKNQRNISPASIHAFEQEYCRKIETYLDTNTGCCWLKDSRIAALVANALRFFDGQRYDLHTWTIMPNHVHVLFTLYESFKLSSIAHSWKSFTAKEANRLLSRSSSFWQPESFDRLIKSQRQMEFTIRYILNNPVKAGLCGEVFGWPWTGCSAEIQDMVKRFF